MRKMASGIASPGAEQQTPFDDRELAHPAGFACTLTHSRTPQTFRGYVVEISNLLHLLPNPGRICRPGIVLWRSG